MSDRATKDYPRDEIVEEVRAARKQLEAQAGGDLDALVELLRQNEAARGRKAASHPPRSVESESAA